MKTSGITATLPAQEMGRAKAFYIEKVDFSQSSPTFLWLVMGRWASRSEMVSTSSSSTPPR